MRASDHFAAYSFVDRIVEFERGSRARGVFAIPAAIDAFPAAFVAEAVGQLAAWVAMDAIEFRGRPVADKRCSSTSTSCRATTKRLPTTAARVSAAER